MARHALLIGVSRFEDKRLAALNAPASDIEALAAVLRDPERGQFDRVTESLDEDFLAIRDRLTTFFDERVPGDLLLLYYSGHGLLGRGNQLFLATPDSNLDRPRTRSLSAAEIREWMDHTRAERTILMLDCSHSGAFVTGLKNSAAPPVVTQDTFNATATGRYVLTAADAQQFAWDGDALRDGDSTARRLSRFTSWLVDGLGRGEASPDDEWITLDALFRYVCRRAKAEGSQAIPQRYDDRRTGDLTIARNPAADIPAWQTPDQPKSQVSIGNVTAGRDIQISGVEFGLPPEKVMELIEATVRPTQRKMEEMAGALGMTRHAMRAMLVRFGKADTSDVSDEGLVQALAEYVESTIRANAEAAEQFNWAEPAKKLPNEAPARQLRAFLCHAKEDKSRIISLYQKLREANVEPWLDVFNLIPGQKWEEEIEKSIRSTDAVLVCLSNASTNKTGYVQAEIKKALDIADRQPEGKIFIVPVRLEQCRVPTRLEPIQYVDYFEADGHNRLLEALHHLSGWLNQSGSTVLVPRVTAASEERARQDIWIEQIKSHPAENIPPEAIPVLIKVLPDTDGGDVRRKIIAILGKLGSATAEVAAEVIPTLIDALGGGQTEPGPHMVDYSAIEAQFALSKIGTAAIPALIKALDDSRQTVVVNARAALARIGPPAVDALVKVRDTSPVEAVQRLASEALTDICSKHHKS